MYFIMTTNCSKPKYDSVCGILWVLMQWQLRYLCFIDGMCLVFVFNPVDMFVFVYSWLRPEIFSSCNILTFVKAGIVAGLLQ